MYMYTYPVHVQKLMAQIHKCGLFQNHGFKQRIWNKPPLWIWTNVFAHDRKIYMDGPKHPIDVFMILNVRNVHWIMP